MFPKQDKKVGEREMGGEGSVCIVRSRISQCDS